MRLASGNVALTATSWGPSVQRCPEGPTRLDREIWVGVPARRADGSGRRTAGRWVAPPAVATVRFSGLRVVRARLSRARLGKATGVPRGADDPQGPNRPGAGGFARRPPGRGSWGSSFSSSGHPHRAPTPGSAFPRRCTRSVHRRPWRRCRPAGADCWYNAGRRDHRMCLLDRHRDRGLRRSQRRGAGIGGA
jgi:hypothetical protein